jgi:hypothetical protein
MVSLLPMARPEGTNSLSEILDLTVLVPNNHRFTGELSWDTPLMEEDSSSSLATGIFSRSHSKTQLNILRKVPRPTNSSFN